MNNEMNKEFKDIPGYAGFKINREGQVMSPRGNLLKQHLCKHGYKYYSLFVNGVNRNRFVHRLLCLTFLGVPENVEKLDVNHKDGNKVNNDLSNLEWATRSENVKHAFDMGLMKRRFKPANIYLAETNELVAENVSIPEWCRENGFTDNQRRSLCKTCHPSSGTKTWFGYYARYIEKGE